MTRRALALGLGLTIVAVPAVAWGVYLLSQRSVPNQPPVAATPAETRILSVLDRMAADRETFFPLDEENGRMLRLLAESTGAKHAVEIGTSTGYSGLWTLLGLRGTGGRLTTFEIDAGRAEQARRHFREAGVGDLVTVVVGDAHQNLKQLEGPIDLLFLDAEKEGYASYLKALLPLVRPGGVIAADNVASAPDYVKAVTSDPRLDTVFRGRFGITIKKR